MDAGLVFVLGAVGFVLMLLVGIVAVDWLHDRWARFRRWLDNHEHSWYN